MGHGAEWGRCRRTSMMLSADGSTLYVNFNDDDFNHTSFAAIHIPESER